MMVISLPMTSKVRAQSIIAVTGEIASASQTTKNGCSAISGMTVFNNDRIRTASQGAAIINLVRLGRIEFGAKTDMTLNLSMGIVGGELHSGRLVVSTRPGVTIAINTAKGLVTADGRQPSVLTINADSDHTLVSAHRYEARLVFGSKVERIAQTPVFAITSLTTSTFICLLNAGINYTIDRAYKMYSKPVQIFDTTITCCDHENSSCRRWGAVTP